MTVKKSASTVDKKSTVSTAVLAATEEPSPVPTTPVALLSDLRALILTTRQTVAQGVNSALVLLYWQMGQRIRLDILKEKRASYCEEIFHALSGKLTAEFGRGFASPTRYLKSNLKQSCMKPSDWREHDCP